MKLQTALRLVYPPRCLLCGGLVESDFGLCGACWRDTPFIGAPACLRCGAPLPGEDDGADGGEGAECDDCLRIARPWNRGAAALAYRGGGRRLVLALKHGDRHDIARPAALWMARIGAPLLARADVVVPVPLHWSRMLRRRYNQAALLAERVAAGAGLAYGPDLLRRRRRTVALGGLGQAARFEHLADAIEAGPRRAAHLAGRRVLLVDDVMTSGATLAASAEACLRVGAGEVFVLTLARALKDA